MLESKLRLRTARHDNLKLWCKLCAVLLLLAVATACAPNSEPTAEAKTPAPLPVKAVIVTMFEIGEDEGDTAGEFQLWKERRNLNERIPFPQSHHDLFYNSESQILGMVTGMGTAKSATATMALGLDPRFDLSKAYWMVAGIAGIDPEDASIGSVAWSSYLVDGDLGHEIDAREIPEDWDTGFFARYTKFPYDPARPEPTGEMFKANAGLRDWAFELTKDAPLVDPEALAPTRALYTEHPNARKPPFVLTGGHIAAMTFWHGKLMNDWANRWVSYWSDGETDFVTSAMEDTGTYQALYYLDKINKVDVDRFLVLRGGSNYTMQPPGVTAAENLLKENDGYAGMEASLENIYIAGSIVIDELLSNWDQYAETVPGSSR
ncbi:MAG: purine nucleoside permease [Pseudomonadota bacterium]|nr:purine nucleoside permease [Pseudomonadota bacterium]